MLHDTTYSESKSTVTVVQEVRPPLIPGDAHVLTVLINHLPGSPGYPPHRLPGGPGFGYMIVAVSRHAVIWPNLAIGHSERCKGRPLSPRPRLTVAGLGLDGRARTASTLRFGCAADTDHRRGRKLQRLRPPRWTSHRVSATEATTTATSRMFVTRAIYREQGASWSMTLTPSRSEIETAGNERY